MHIMNFLPSIEAVRKRPGLYVGQDGNQANRVIAEIVNLGKNFSEPQVEVFGEKIIVTFDMREEVLEDIPDGDFPGSILFRKMFLLMTELAAPGYFANVCNPAISTALSRKMEISLPEKDFREVGRWVNGVFQGRSIDVYRDNKIRIKFIPDTELLEGK